jgi:hypothetical protein
MDQPPSPQYCAMPLASLSDHGVQTDRVLSEQDLVERIAGERKRPREIVELDLAGLAAKDNAETAPRRLGSPASTRMIGSACISPPVVRVI